MDYLWIFVLLAVGLFLLLMEVFIPSYGLLSVGGVGSLAAGLYLAFKMSPALGVFALVVVAVCLPLEIIIGVKLFPRTWIGTRIVMAARGRTTRQDRSSPPDIFELVGKEGVTTTACRPSGVARIGASRVDVVAEGTMIDANRPVKVLRVEGNRVVVREKQA